MIWDDTDLGHDAVQVAWTLVWGRLGELREPERLKSWLAQNNGVIMAVLLLIIGAKLIGDAIAGFSS